MKKNLFFRFTIFFILALFMGGTLKPALFAGSRKIIVGTIGVIPNVTFTDKDGKLTGYDVEVVREIAKRVPGLEVTFQILDFPNLLLSLDTKKIDLAACLLEVNKEREAKYLHPTESYLVMVDKLTVHQSNTTIHSINDMAGKILILSTGSNEQMIGEKWNKEHGNIIKLAYSSSGPVDIVTQIKSGRADAAIYTDFDVRNYNTMANAQWKIVGEPLAVANCYQLMRKDDKELAAMIDKALKAMKADGTLSKLSIQWLGQDFTQAPK